jgi:membrane protein implicated in regulation of membrane protease activity
MAPSLLWLLGAAVFFAIEAFGVPGIGFLFAALAAMSVALMIEVGILMPLDSTYQFAAFFCNTTLFAILLWKKLKSWRMNPKAPGYSNMIGDRAVIAGSGLQPGHIGEVRWSGTLMRARLAEDAAALPVGAEVTITQVEGNVLTVKPL